MCVCVCVCVCGCVVEGCSYPLAIVSVLDYSTGVSYRYEYLTETTLNQAAPLDHQHTASDTSSDHHQQQSGARRDVGFRLSTTVDVTPVWTDDNGLIIVKLEVICFRYRYNHRLRLSRLHIQQKKTTGGALA